jgi:uncharacterized protein (TIGR03067 family)
LGEIKGMVNLDLAMKPRRMVITHESSAEKGKKQYAVYKLEGDKFTAFVSQPGVPELVCRPFDRSAPAEK